MSTSYETLKALQFLGVRNNQLLLNKIAGTRRAAKGGIPRTRGKLAKTISPA